MSLRVQQRDQLTLLVLLFSVKVNYLNNKLYMKPLEFRFDFSNIS